MHPDIISGHLLARRLERTEAVANARFVEARARLVPGSGAQWIEVAGAYAMYDGARSPCTQTFGLGLFQMPTPADMDSFEAFFRDRQAPVFHEICPLADKALLPMLHERDYKPVELLSPNGAAEVRNGYCSKGAFSTPRRPGATLQWSAPNRVAPPSVTPSTKAFISLTRASNSVLQAQ